LPHAQSQQTRVSRDILDKKLKTRLLRGEMRRWLGAESNRRFKDQKCADPLPEPFLEENQQNTREVDEIIEFKFLYGMI
jgi:hypothetical protein